MQFVSGDPDSVSEAMQSNCSAQWKAAKTEEFESLNANKTWQLQAGAIVFKSKWVFKTKRNESGDIECWQAMLVSKGLS